MAHLNKRKHVKHLHVHGHPAPHKEPKRERHPAASYRELGRALVHRVASRLYLRLMRKPRAFFEKLSGLYSRANA